MEEGMKAIIKEMKIYIAELNHTIKCEGIEISKHQNRCAALNDVKYGAEKALDNMKKHSRLKDGKVPTIKTKGE